MLRDALEAGWFKPETLANAVVSVKDYKPTVLILSEDQFQRYVNALTIHPTGAWLQGELRKVGIHRLIWAEYLKDNEFELTSEESWKKLFDESDIETLTLK